ncbi:MAG: hypothetical protein Q9M82_04090 [Mariprofundus sp.]|nr:hypothetical protein [Mariprofundus sp.]
MKWIRLLLIMPLMAPMVVYAQPANGNAKTQQLVNELKILTDQAEQNRSANYRLIDQLRDLTARYDWPWGKRVLFDNFRDGDFRQNPAWYSSSNDFWVTRSVGLRTELNRESNQPRTNQPAQSGHDRKREAREAIIGMILGGGVEQTEPGYRPSRRINRPVRADISTNLGIDNAFAITIKLASIGRGNHEGSFEFGPYQGQDMESGYRLVYRGGANPALKLVSYRRHLTSVIDLYDRGKLLADGNIHTLDWQRTRSGQMTVLLDGKQILSVRDRSYRDSFSGFVMTNRGGDYSIRSVSIFTARR